MEHLDSLLKLKDERIDELQNQLERKQARRKEAESLTNTLAVPFEPVPPSPKPRSEFIVMPVKTVSLKNIESKSKIEESRIPVPKDSLNTLSRPSLTEVSMADLNDKNALDRIKSDVFKEVEYVDERNEIFQDLDVFEEFKDSEQENITTIEDTIQQEIKEIGKPMEYIQDMSFVNWLVSNNLKKPMG